jgi:hypothetical protein
VAARRSCGQALRCGSWRFLADGGGEGELPQATVALHGEGGGALAAVLFSLSPCTGYLVEAVVRRLVAHDVLLEIGSFSLTTCGGLLRLLDRTKG